MFSKLLVYLCQVSNDDGPYPIIAPDNAETKSERIARITVEVVCLPLTGGTKYLSQTILEILLSLLKKEVPENGRHLQQYFHVFLAYAMRGFREVCNGQDYKQFLFNFFTETAVNTTWSS